MEPFYQVGKKETTTGVIRANLSQSNYVRRNIKERFINPIYLEVMRECGNSVSERKYLVSPSITSMPDKVPAWRKRANPPLPSLQEDTTDICWSFG